MNRSTRTRLFLDSNVIVAGIVSRWGLDKALLSICAARISRLVLAEAVHLEVEQNLKRIGARLSSKDATDLIEVYRQFLELSDPEMVPFPDAESERKSRHLIRHQADVAVLLSAVSSRPAWLLTNNTKHFTQQVAHRSGLRIGIPAEFFQCAMLPLSGLSE